MKDEAGEGGGSQESTIEALIKKAASRSRPKYEPVAPQIERLRAAGVTLPAIVSWLASQGIKAEVGELWRWLKRRQVRAAKAKKEQALIALALGQADGETATGSVPAISPKQGQPVTQETPTQAPAPKPGQAAAWTPQRAPDPSDRPGTSEREKELDALIAKTLQESQAKRSPFALKSKAAEKK